MRRPASSRPRFLAARALLALVVLFALATPAAARVFVIGVDGGSWGVIDPMLARGELPHLAALMARGVAARMDTVEPVISPTVWTSIATGRSPAAHGVTGFLATRLSRRVPTIFERLAARGLRVGLYDWLVTWPPNAPAGGFVIPGWLRRDPSVAPADVWTRAGVTPYFWEANARTPDGFVARAREEVVRKAPTWNALAAAFLLDVGGVTFYSVDATSHRFWQDAFPGQFGDVKPAEPSAYAGVIPEVMRGIDRSVGEIVAGLSPDDTVIVVSDHGFQADTRGRRRIWVMQLADHLSQFGLDPDRDGFNFVGEFFAVVLRVRPGPIAERDAVTERWAALLRGAHATGGQPIFSGVEVVDAAPRPPGAERPWLTRARQAAVRLVLRYAFDEHLEAPAHAWVIARPDHEVLDALWPDGTVEIGGVRLPVREAAHPDDFSGRHEPTAVFVAAGGPVRPVSGRARVSVLDVAPLVAYLAGQPIPDDLEGRLPADWIAPAWLAAHPARHEPAPPWRPEGGGADVPGAADDAAVIERLRALGYVR